MNADQHIALASVIAGGATAIVAVIGTVVSGSLDRGHQEKMAKTERQQARLSDAYIGLLDYAAKVGYWAQHVRPVVDTDPPQPPPPTPDFDTYSAVMAKVDAFGSERVKELMEAWNGAVRDVQKADLLVGLRRSAADRHAGYRPTRPNENLDWMDYDTPWMKLEDELRPAEVAARDALKDQVAAELK